jgi:hypothetical protein
VIYLALEVDTMTRQEAIKKLGRLYGKKAGYRVSGGASNADERAAARDASRELGALKRELDAQIEKRKAELLNVPDYVEMLKTREDIKKQINSATSLLLSYKFTAGYVSSMGFFHVEGQGDTWEEVFAQINEKNPRGVTI